MKASNVQVGVPGSLGKTGMRDCCPFILFSLNRAKPGPLAMWYYKSWRGPTGMEPT